ncbi:hypothetical protein [Streptomyces sp. WAC01280]|uniref:hypothetical protein n=1 Tax=Streptomyces sp. WAC01280 TaxID=2487424 RepID=UPI000F76E4DC|nr:hypothetical protein [Streptomyces sp. WAC01280]RSS57454.1 hypothetical protein EF909_16030 [Streptomyces sp. WAC01280]
MTSYPPSPARLGPRETVVLVSTTVLFCSSTVALAALGLPVTDILTLLGFTAGAVVVTVSVVIGASAARSTREMNREAVLALARLTRQI